ncbi:MAG: DUF1653 domain-containing protein [Eubacterium sp.]|nr:DUF1653 domain-containing protein [Eubacterium sp.]
MKRRKVMDIEYCRYRHYKGNEYEVIALAKHSETLEDMVIYRDVNSPEKVWARPAHMWNEEVSVNGKTVRRFQKISN